MRTRPLRRVDAAVSRFVPSLLILFFFFSFFFWYILDLGFFFVLRD